MKISWASIHDDCRRNQPIGWTWETPTSTMMGPWAALRSAIMHPETRQRAWGTHLRSRERNERESLPTGRGAEVFPDKMNDIIFS